MNRTTQPFRPPVRAIPGKFRGPFTRWPRAADAVFAAVVFLVLVFVMDTPGDTLALRPLGDVGILSLPVLVAAGAALYWRRRAPLAVLAVTLTAWALMLMAVHTPIGIPVLIALYSAGRYSSEEPSWRGPAGFTAAVAMVTIDMRTDSAPWGEVAFGVVVMCALWYSGRGLRLRDQHAARILAEQAAEASRIVAEERARIARELHDVVAHRVSVMTVQAAAAKAMAAHAADGPVPEMALRAMGAVEEEGRQALAELRHLLNVLRPDSGSAGPEPQPGLADVPRLIDQIRRTGVTVTLSMNGLPTGLPARVDLFAYRIVQEALTNVLKHAGPGTHAEVRLSVGTGNEIVIEVLDDGRGTTALPGPGDGRGATVLPGLGGVRGTTAPPGPGDGRGAIALPEPSVGRGAMSLSGSGIGHDAAAPPEQDDGRGATALPESGVGRNVAALSGPSDGHGAVRLSGQDDGRIATDLPEPGVGRGATALPGSGGVRGVTALPGQDAGRGSAALRGPGEGRGANVPRGSGDVQGGTKGHGIVGMRERALLLGGTLDVGRRPGGGFEVVAHLPTGGEPT